MFCQTQWILYKVNRAKAFFVGIRFDINVYEIRVHIDLKGTLEVEEPTSSDKETPQNFKTQNTIKVALYSETCLVFIFNEGSSSS